MLLLLLLVAAQEVRQQGVLLQEVQLLGGRLGHQQAGERLAVLHNVLQEGHHRVVVRRTGMALPQRVERHISGLVGG